MANVSVQIETRIKHDLSLSFQAVAGDESLNVGTLVFQAKKSNLNLLVDFTDKNIPYQHSGIVALESTLKKNRVLIVNFLKAVLEGLSFYKRNKEETLNVMAKYTGLRDRAVLANSYEWFKKVFLDVPYATPDGFKSILDMIYVSRKGVPTLDPKTLVDRTILDALANDGFIQSLNAGSR